MRAYERGNEEGQMTIFLLLGLFVLMCLVALGVDSSAAFSSVRNLRSLADGSARAGAMAIDEGKLRETGGSVVELDREAAWEAAREYLNLSGFKGSVDIATGASEVRVHLTRKTKTLMMSFIGLDEVETDASAVARPRTGIERPNG
jgi:putative Flp pilus-assembly TadE/G-like protein